MNDKIKLCPKHISEYPSPLIDVSGFRGREIGYWCPYCGFQCNLLFKSPELEASSQLQTRLEVYKISSERFLDDKEGWDYYKKSEDLERDMVYVISSLNHLLNNEKDALADALKYLQEDNLEAECRKSFEESKRLAEIRIPQLERAILLLKNVRHEQSFS